MENKFLQEFKIPFVGMKKQLYQFEYLIGDGFFQNFPESDLDKCSIEVKVDFDKRENFFLLTFYIDGTVEIPCDRCTEPFNQDVFGDYEVAVKFGETDNVEQIDEDVVYISKSDDFIDVSNLIYEFIILSIPLRCAHPENDEGNSACNKEIIKKLQKEDKPSADPRWAALEKLKIKK
ncbi:MAG: hypothetical protein ACI9O4_000692 [Chitinophagales bacterium]|jgi:uncharacterized protein